MSAPTEQFTEQFQEIAARAQESVSTAVRTWAEAIQSVTDGFGADRPALVDPTVLVERYFDFVQQVLDSQRQFAHTVLTAGVQAAKTAGEQSVAAAKQATEQTVSAVESTTEQVVNGAKAAPAAARVTRSTSK